MLSLLTCGFDQSFKQHAFFVTFLIVSIYPCVIDNLIDADGFYGWLGYCFCAHWVLLLRLVATQHNNLTTQLIYTKTNSIG